MWVRFMITFASMPRSVVHFLLRAPLWSSSPPLRLYLYSHRCPSFIILLFSHQYYVARSRTISTSFPDFLLNFSHCRCRFNFFVSYPCDTSIIHSHLCDLQLFHVHSISSLFFCQTALRIFSSTQLSNLFLHHLLVSIQYT